MGYDCLGECGPVTDISKTCVVVTLRVKVKCITSSVDDYETLDIDLIGQ